LGRVAGAPVPDFLVAGWAGAREVTVRTLQRAFERELTPAELAVWRTGEEGRRAAGGVSDPAGDWPQRGLGTRP
jgi:putative transposase